MKEEQGRGGMSRRDFVKGVVAGGAGLYASRVMGREPQTWAAEATDIGQCKSVKVT